MKVYNVNCHSTCGSYFASYLQSVTVIVEDEDSAIESVEKWLKKEGRKFIYGKDKWRVHCVCENTEGVIDYHEDSDY